MQAQKGSTVKVHYTGKLQDGTIFDSSEGRAPLEFVLGSGMMIKGFDAGVTDMKVGEKKTITIPCDEAYGQHNPEMIIPFPKTNFPEDMPIELGMELPMQDQGGNRFNVTVTAINENEVMLDANHRLAGKDLVFDLELVEVQ
jgi:FKBP-type peptidyl-prolyl cis-trans isomerase 2